MHTIYRPKRGRLSLAASLTIILSGVAILGVRANDVTRTVLKAEPLGKTDGTAAHPYPDATQCPPNTDIVIWPEEWQAIPNVPSVFSVCFVGGQPNHKNGGGLETRGR